MNLHYQIVSLISPSVLSFGYGWKSLAEELGYLECALHFDTSTIGVNIFWEDDSEPLGFSGPDLGRLISVLRAASPYMP